MPAHQMALLLVVALLQLQRVHSQQAYCWDACTYNCPNRGPRLCPAEGIMTYYDCCVDGCCEYIKWPNLVFLILIGFTLLIGCGCCCFFILSDARKRYRHRDANKRQVSRRQLRSQRRQENQIATVEEQMRPMPPPRQFQHRHSTVV